MEQLLAVDPAARQLVEELPALGKTLHSLPREKIGEDLGPRVLQLAQRRMLTEPPQANPENTRKSSPLRRRPLGEAAALPNTIRGMFSRQALVWSGLAVAIAVMMMIWNRPAETRRIALAPSPAAPESPAAEPAERTQHLTIQALPKPGVAAETLRKLKSPQAPQARRRRRRLGRLALRRLNRPPPPILPRQWTKTQRAVASASRLLPAFAATRDSFRLAGWRRSLPPQKRPRRCRSRSRQSKRDSAPNRAHRKQPPAE